MSKQALAQLGLLLAEAARALEAILAPQYLYIGRYGHTPGYALHSHIIPICDWIMRSFFENPRYRILQDPQGDTGIDQTDGVELTVYIWREFCGRTKCPKIPDPAISDVVENARALMHQP